MRKQTGGGPEEILNLQNTTGIQIKASEYDENTITITKYVKNEFDEDVPMQILIHSGPLLFAGRKFYLKPNDLVIIEVAVGTQEQHLEGRAAIPKGSFTNFFKDILGKNVFYVLSPTDYWKKTFHTLTDEEIPFGMSKHQVEGDREQTKSGKKKRKKQKKRTKKQRRCSKRRSSLQH